jgi:hypothetical protein
MSCLLQTSDAKCDAEVELKSDAQVWVHGKWRQVFLAVWW